MKEATPSNYLFVLVAASAVGKSVLVNKLCDEGLWLKANKYSTRDNRGQEDDVVKIDDQSINDSSDEETKTKIRLSRMENLVNICGQGRGVVYYKNDNIYGVSISEIQEGLKKSHLAVIISDFHVIDKLREKLGNRIKVMYIASTIDEKVLFQRFKEREKDKYQEELKKMTEIIGGIQDKVVKLSSAIRLQYVSKVDDIIRNINEKWNTNLSSYETVKTRSFNIRMLYNRYIDNISKIDYAILNTRNQDEEYMFKQARNILKNVKPKREIQLTKPPIFMVCAAKSSGKKTLMEIIGDIGDVHSNIVKTTKFGTRDREDTDGRDMIAIGEGADFKEHMEKRFEMQIRDGEGGDIWKWGFMQRPTEYAVCHKEIKLNEEKNIAQFFISNMGQIDYAREKYSENIVVLYLHATHETKTEEHIQKKQKNKLLKEIKNTNPNFTDIQVEEIFYNDKKIQEKFNKKVEEDKEEIMNVHDAFCEHNTNIDHVLLNTGTREDLIEQMTNLINYYTKKSEDHPA